ncbi:MAG: hypothetical protein LBD23_20710 [Oscillospiraceae bacterium]|jgi:beta-mannosidase|nr:hypothetical protein [Oscillospiraceae bacterium]
MNDLFLSLNGSWSLTFYPESDESDTRTIPATVPGNVELDLIAAGIEEDPFFALNALNYRKYEFYAWRFERDFDLPDDFSGKDVILRLDGLDTFGEIFINGVSVGDCDNMLIPHEFDVSAYVKPGAPNSIAIHIASPVNRARDMDFPAGIRIWETMGDEFLAIRKPAHSFGWDIACRLLSAGIWRDIGLYARENTYIDQVYYSTLSLREGVADLGVRYRFKTDDPYLDGFSIRVEGVCGDSHFSVEAPCTFVTGKTVVTINDPKLWWPAGHGLPNLYDVTFTVLHNGKAVAERKERIGLRKVVLERSYGGPDYGQFRFVVNDVPIMVRGTNWVPLDCLHSRDLARLPEAHALLRDIGCNMVRMWGGNVYESDEFYELCDKHGIMVWQDFSLACGLYSQYDDFCKVIEKEAAAIIKRLRNHTSIALWAGDNEIDMAYAIIGHTLPHAFYNRISREILPRAVSMNDPFREYIPSSPVIEGDCSRIDYDMPEQHNWGPRDYYKGDFHRLCKAYFISETGYHGSPSVSSLKKFIPENEVWPYSEESLSWIMHNTDYLPAPRRGYDRNVLMRKQVNTMFGFIPDEIEEFTLASQVCQAEAVKFLIENTLIQKWRRTGILWWNLIDGWPQTSDSVVDYYFQKKLAYYYIKRIQAPITIIIGEPEGWQHRVVLCNNSLDAPTVSYKITDFDSDDVVLKGTAMPPPNENIDLPSIPNIPGEKKLYIIEWEIDGVKAANHYAGGYVPMDFEQYKKWLKAIAALPECFEPEACYL